METQREKFLESINRLGTLRAACEETGIAPYIGYLWAKKAGALSERDGRSYGTLASRLGVEAEAEFRRLVPNALYANRDLSENCPSFDFDVEGTTVDVKYSSIRQSIGAWEFKTAQRKPFAPDFYAAFFASMVSGKLSDGYHLFLIPHDLVGGRSCVQLRPENQKSIWWQFKVNPVDLAAVLRGEVVTGAVEVVS